MRFLLIDTDSFYLIIFTENNYFFEIFKFFSEK